MPLEGNEKREPTSLMGLRCHDQSVDRVQAATYIILLLKTRVMDDERSMNIRFCLWRNPLMKKKKSRHAALISTLVRALSVVDRKNLFNESRSD